MKIKPLSYYLITEKFNKKNFIICKINSIFDDEMMSMVSGKSWFFKNGKPTSWNCWCTPMLDFQQKIVNGKYIESKNIKNTTIKKIISLMKLRDIK